MAQPAAGEWETSTQLQPQAGKFAEQIFCGSHLARWEVLFHKNLGNKNLTCTELTEALKARTARRAFDWLGQITFDGVKKGVNQFVREGKSPSNSAARIGYKIVLEKYLETPTNWSQYTLRNHWPVLDAKDRT